MKNIIITGIFAMLMLAAPVMAVTTVSTTWEGHGYAKFVMTAPHVESTVETFANQGESWGFNGQQSFNMVDVTETQVSRTSQFQYGGLLAQLTD